MDCILNLIENQWSYMKAVHSMQLSAGSWTGRTFQVLAHSGASLIYQPGEAGEDSVVHKASAVTSGGGEVTSCSG